MTFSTTAGRPRQALLAIALCASIAGAATAKAAPTAGDAAVAAPQAPAPAPDYVMREEMISMRDGVKLFTVIIIPHAAKAAPVLLTRTPFGAQAFVRRDARSLAELLPPGEAIFPAAGYIRVYQDVRGRNRSQGVYEVARPARGPLNPSETDHTTDAYDTIDWLVSHLAQSNGSVGMVGSSYAGFTVAMALLDPHPALKAAVPQNPMIDGWMGDDWFHHGAFRQNTFDFLAVVARNEGLPRKDYDDYELFRRVGSAGDMARSAGLAQHPFWRQLEAHPAYGAHWRDQALDRLLAAKALKVPTLWVGALWDQEDSYGAVRAYEALEAKDDQNDRNFLVLGPWRHGGMNGDGSQLGPLAFDSDTGRQFRERVLLPFLDEHLRAGSEKADLPPVLAFQTGSNQWRAMTRWPPTCAGACPAASRRLFLRSQGKLSFEPPEVSSPRDADTYVSDPDRPVPYAARPVRNDDPGQWRNWLTADQRFAEGRPDVLTYVSDPLIEPLALSGAPGVSLHAATTGSDADWVVKLIDVNPDEAPGRSELGGYELMVAGDIFRGRYRQGFDQALPIKAGKADLYRFSLPHLNHVFLPGHRIMVQVQSSWFPLYDRNPQTFVSNIFNAKLADYRSAVQTVFRSAAAPSSIDLPITTAAPVGWSSSPAVETAVRP